MVHKWRGESRQRREARKKIPGFGKLLQASGMAVAVDAEPACPVPCSPAAYGTIPAKSAPCSGPRTILHPWSVTPPAWVAVPPHPKPRLHASLMNSATWKLICFGPHAPPASAWGQLPPFNHPLPQLLVFLQAPSLNLAPQQNLRLQLDISLRLLASLSSCCCCCCCGWKYNNSSCCCSFH